MGPQGGPDRRPRRGSSPLAIPPGLSEGFPVVAELHSGIHFISLRSYLKPLAFLRASLFEFMTRYAPNRATRTWRCLKQRLNGS
jgi:hypothetical protein